MNKCAECGITRAFDLGYPAEMSIAFVTCEHCSKVLCGQCVFAHELDHRNEAKESRSDQD